MAWRSDDWGRLPGEVPRADLQESRRGCWHVVTPKNKSVKVASSQTPHIRKENATRRRRSDTTTTPSLDQVRNLFVVWRSIDRSGPGQTRPGQLAGSSDNGTIAPDRERVMVNRMSRAHRSFMGLDASSYISRCSLCEWCTTQRHNETQRDTTTQRHNDHSQLLQVRNSFVVYRSGQARPGQLAPMEPAQPVCVCVCLRVAQLYDGYVPPRSTNFSLARSVDRGGDCARP